MQFIAVFVDFATKCFSKCKVFCATRTAVFFENLFSRLFEFFIILIKDLQAFISNAFTKPTKSSNQYGIFGKTLLALFMKCLKT